jgi:hypothetical protein
MLLPDSLERDLSHTSILYYRNILYNKIFEHWRRVVSKNKKGVPCHWASLNSIIIEAITQIELARGTKTKCDKRGLTIDSGR